MMAGPQGGSGRRHCWSRGRRRGTGGTPGVGYEIAQNLEVPVPQMGEQLPDVLQFFASFLPRVAEQVIEVPKIFLDRTPQRLGDHLRQPQMVEQLVHVPTVVSYSSLQQLTAEQIVDIPVPGRDGGGARGGLQGFPPGQNSAALHVEQPVDIPVPQGRGGVGARGGLQGFAGQSSTASSSRVGAADGAGRGVFRTFPKIKKSAKQGPHSGSALLPESSPSMLSAHQMPLDEQLVDVPVPQVSERSSRSLPAGGRRRRRRPGGGSRTPFWKMRMRKRMRTMKRRRSRASLLTSVLAGVSSCSLVASALVGGSAPLHTMSQNSTRTHGSAWCWWLVGLGSGAWHPLDPSWVPLPVLRGRLNILEARGQGLGIP